MELSDSSVFISACSINRQYPVIVIFEMGPMTGNSRPSGAINRGNHLSAGFIKSFYPLYSMYFNRLQGVIAMNFIITFVFIIAIKKGAGGCLYLPILVSER